MAKDYKIFHVRGDDQLSHCLAHEECDGYELLYLLWTGNLQASTPSLISPSGDPSKIGIIHLYLVVFTRLQEKVGKESFPSFPQISDS